MTRYAGPVRIQLSQPSDTALIDQGRKLVGALEVRGEPVGALRRQLADGSVIEATKVGTQHAIRIASPPPGGPPPDGPMEEIIHLYISSPGGLRIFDLGTKALVQTITGLHPYEVDGVSADGNVVWMGGNATAVRVDVPAMTAFGYVYNADAVDFEGNHTAGFADVGSGAVSPDGTLVLWRFGAVYEPGTGVILSGLGGYALADAETLVPVRPSIRMSFRPHAEAWAPDSQRFYLGTSLAADPGDYSDPAVATSTSDYIAVFTRDGVLRNSVLVASWSTAPDAGYQRRVRLLAASASHLYAVVTREGSASNWLDTYAIDGNALTLVDSQLLSGSFLEQTSLHVSRDQSKLVVTRQDPYTTGVFTLDEYDIRDGAPVLRYSVNGADFAGPARHTLYAGNAPNGIVQSGPRSRVGQPDDVRRFFYNFSSGEFSRVRGYRGFDKTPVYEIDLSAYALRSRYRLAAVGVRPATRTPA